MSNEILQGSRSVFTAQDAEGAAVSVGSYCSGSQTVIDNTYDGGSENSRGAFAMDIFFDVSIAASSNYAYADIYIQHSADGTNFGDLIFLARSPSINTASSGLIFVCRMTELPPYFKLKWKAYSHTVDGAIKVIPYFMELQT